MIEHNKSQGIPTPRSEKSVSELQKAKLSRASIISVNLDKELLEN